MSIVFVINLWTPEDEDEPTPETEPTDEPPIILDGDDDAGEDTDE